MNRRRLLIPLTAFALLLLIAACSPAAPVDTTPVNTAPVITISSPTASATYSVGEPVVLAATATDAEDGDLTAAITWSSSLDGALSPSATGEVLLTVGSHVLTARVTDADGADGSAAVSVTVTDAVATHVVADGRTLRLVDVSGGAIVELDSAELLGGSVYQTIFGIVAHPTQPWLYTGSTYDGYGDARIDRFVLAGDTITLAGTAFSYPFSEIAADCVEPSWDYCAPIGMVFSPDGSRLYVGEADYGRLQVFSVDATGDLTFIAEGAGTDMHGLTIDPTGTYIYNGSKVIEVTDDEPVTVFAGDGGNATQIVTLASGPGLISTRFTNTLAIYDLGDPVDPVLQADILVGNNQARDLAFADGLDRIVAVGRNNVHSLSFDGTALALDATHTVSETFTIDYRSVGLTSDGAYALAAWFSHSSSAPALGGVDLFEVAADGGLTPVDSVNFMGPARVVHTLP